jgi:ASC-1-like (ASCH) protein
MYDFSIRLEKDIRDNNSVKMSKKTKDLWNEIQIESIFGKQSTMELFYDLYEDLLDSAEEYRKGAVKMLTDNNKKILNFYAHIKNELGIKA